MKGFYKHNRLNPFLFLEYIGLAGEMVGYFFEIVDLLLSKTGKTIYVKKVL